MSRIWLRMRRAARESARRYKGIAAIEFAMIVPLMLVLFFGTVEFSFRRRGRPQGDAWMARTLSDLTSQNISVTDTQLTNIFNASTGPS